MFLTHRIVVEFSEYALLLALEKQCTCHVIEDVRRSNEKALTRASASLGVG